MISWFWFIVCIVLQAPERVVRDKNLSVISCLSCSAATPPHDSPSRPLLPSPTPPPPPPPSPPPSMQGSGLDGRSARQQQQQQQQQTTPSTGHMTTHSIRLTQEEQQRELKALRDKVCDSLAAQQAHHNCQFPDPLSLFALQVESLLQNQFSPSSSATPTADASTSIGASLCLGSPPPPPPPPPPAAVVAAATPSYSSQCSSEEVSLSLNLANDFNWRGSTSTVSRDDARIHLDLNSLGEFNVMYCSTL